MARGRMVYREFFTSGDLVDEPYWVAVLFAGMIVYADDRGWIRDQMTFFRGTLLARSQRARVPSAMQVRRALERLSTRRVLVRQVLNDVTYWEIRNFFKFQRLSEAKRSEDEEKRSEAKATTPLARGSQSQSLPDKKAAHEPASRHEAAGDDANPIAAYLRLLRQWGSDERDMPKARSMLERAGGATNDCVRAWLRCRELAGKQKSVRDPDAFTRLKALRFPHPDAAGIDFWKASQREAGTRRGPQPRKASAAEAAVPVGEVLRTIPEDLKPPARKK